MYMLCEDVQLNLTSEQHAAYVWYVNSDLYSSERDATIVINTLGTHLIELEVFNEFGCSNIDKRLIETTECLLPTFYVPNAFTPLGDNPTWFPVGENIIIKSVLVFTRDGELIFDALTPWDGTYNDKLVQGGVYAYKIEYSDLNGGVFGVTGRVTVVY